MGVKWWGKMEKRVSGYLKKVLRPKDVVESIYLVNWRGLKSKNRYFTLILSVEVSHFKFT